MQLSSIITVLASGLALVAAQESAGTTTSTSTMTMTVTITRCNPTYTNCPVSNTSTTAPYPVTNSTSSAGPTAYPTANTTTYAAPTTRTTVTQTSTLGSSSTKPVTVPTGSSSGAGTLLVQSGLLLGLLGAGIAVLA